MKNDYLFDGTGEPDPELLRIEKSLAQFRYSAETPVFPALDSLQVQPSFLSRLALAWNPRFAAATLLFVGFFAAGMTLRISSIPDPSAPGWNVARISGSPRIGGRLVGDAAHNSKLTVGALLATDDFSRASVTVNEIGEVAVDPGSRVRLVETGTTRERLALELGTIHAAIWAPPGKFVVDTPSATAVDLGCAYTLKVNGDGSGELRTTVGWVGFHKNGHDSFIPAGAMCLTHPVEGPGTPFFEDASEKLRNALHDLDFANLSPGQRSAALQTLLAEARTKDAFTLWHLLPRVSAAERPSVYDHMASLVKTPAGVTRDGSLALNSNMLDAWWNAFHLGDISVWRYWEQNQAPPPAEKITR